MKWIFALLATAQFAFAVDTIPLAGEWRFAMDRADTGIAENWPTRNLPDTIKLPGVLQAQGYGDEISTNTPWVLSLYDRNWFLRADYTNYTHAGAVKVPFVSQPPMHYLGAAWYQRDIEIPADWAGNRLVLFLERPHWESRVWLDGNLIGTNNSLCAPHEFELGVGIAPGKHTLTVRVDNRMLMPYRPDAHSISDSLAQSWNGIVGQMELRATPLVWIEDVQVYPSFEKNNVQTKVLVGNLTGNSVTNWLALSFIPRMGDRGSGRPELVKVVSNSRWTVVEAELKSEFPVLAWNEFSPVMYTLTAAIRPDRQSLSVTEKKEVFFGFRDFKRDGTQFTLNGQPAYLRGTHSGGDFPLTGHPPMEVDYWLKLFQTCKDYGLNHMRFHSFCPPDAAFAAADEVGFYICIEPGMWNTFDVGSPMEAMLYAETERINKAYGNHPSFMLFSPSNEPKGHWRDVLPKWAEHFRTVDPRRLYTSGTGFTDPDAPGPLDKLDWTTTSRFGRNQVRGPSGWFGKDYSSALEGVTIPVVAHELGQWDAYPDYDVIKKFTGYMRPGNYEIFRDSAAAHGVLDRNRDFVKASGKFQVECYKEEIEANLLTRGLAGFQLLDLHDYVGQGSAFVGVLDPFWESKGYVTPAEFRKFCNVVVPLARLKQRVFTTAETLASDVEVANYSATPLTNAASWEICDAAENVVLAGTFASNTIPLGKNFALGTVNVDLSKLPAPSAYKLVVKVGTYANDWKFWVYPEAVSTAVPADVLTTSSWDEAAAKLAAGGKVLFIPHAADLGWTCPPLDNVPVFWDRLMNPNWGRMMGLWCDTGHGALAEFPTEENCDWQWTQIIRGVRAVNLDKLPYGLQPIVSAVDDWNRNWKLGVVFEARVGTGKLVVCSIDLERSQSPVAKQLRRSLLDYMAGEQFAPVTAISPAEFLSLYFDSRIMSHVGATAAAEGENASGAIDGDPNTYWSVGAPARGRDAGAPAKRPHVLTISFAQPVAMSGLVVMPRQNDRDHIGDVRGFEVQASEDGTNWQPVVQGELVSSFDPKTIRFSKTITAKQIKFSSLSGFGNDPATAIAEVAVIYAGPKVSDNAGGDVHYQRVRSTSTDVDEGGGSSTNKP